MKRQIGLFRSVDQNKIGLGWKIPKTVLFPSDVDIRYFHRKRERRELKV